MKIFNYIINGIIRRTGTSKSKRVFGIYLTKILPPNAFKTAFESRYVKERERLEKEIHYYMFECESGHPVEHKLRYNVIQALHQELIVLDARKELGLIQ